MAAAARPYSGGNHSWCVVQFVAFCVFCVLCNFENTVGFFELKINLSVVVTIMIVRYSTTFLSATVEVHNINEAQMHSINVQRYHLEKLEV